MRYQGKITSWKDQQGFGFVTTNGSGQKAFVHIKAFTKHSRRPIEGDSITYELVPEAKGRFRADGVRFVGDRARIESTSKTRSLKIIFVGAFCCFLIVASLAGRLPILILGFYAAVSLITFGIYAIDKSAAQNNRWRTKESSLHLCSLIGGWPGAFLAQNILHHKSKKEEFQSVYWMTVVLNCGALGWLFTNRGTAFIDSVINTYV